MSPVPTDVEMATSIYDGADLAQLETVIETGLDAFMRVGLALTTIRTRRLYLDGWRTFEDYCQERWGFNRVYAHRLIEAAAVAAALPMGNRPENERQARALKAVPTTARAEVMQAATEATDGAVTAATIETFATNIADATRDTEPDRVEAATEAAIEETRTAIRSGITKPDLDGNGLSHPARYSSALLPIFADLLERYTHGVASTVLDPFGGAGGIHQLRDEELGGWITVAVEIEPEWAALHEHTEVGDATDLFFPDESFDCVVTSPCYGNRLADAHDAQDASVRRSYKFDLGRDLSEGSAGDLQWGDEYRAFHERAWAEAARVLRYGGVFLLNVSDHIRGGVRQAVTGWHVATLLDLGLELLDVVPVSTGRLRQGANATARVDAELVIAFRKTVAS